MTAEGLADRPRLRVGVTRLVHALDPGSLGFREAAGGQAAWLGSTLHTRYQREAFGRLPEFEAEVALSRTLAHEGWEIEVRGRCDGLYRPDPEHLMVQELKTTFGSRRPPAEIREGHALQARVYAWMVAASRDEPCGAELVWLPADGGPPTTEPVPWDEAGLLARLEPLLDEVVFQEQRRRERLAARRAAALRVRFPHASRRPGQEEIERAVARAIEQEEHLLLEAPTGLGKTAAVLTPALRLALARDRRIFFATASTLQQRLAVDTLATLAPDDLPTAARLRAKRRMCLLEEPVCHPGACPHAVDYQEKVRSGGLAERCFEERPLALPDFVRALGREHEACPFELSLDAAALAPVTVGDLNYAFDPVVALREWSEPAALRDAIFIVDEAHQLAARARDTLGARLDVDALREAIAGVALGGAPVHRHQREALEAVTAFVEAELDEALGPGSPGMVRHRADPEQRLALAAALDAVVLETLDALKGDPAEGPAAAFLRAAAGFRAWNAEPRGVFVPLAARDGAGARLERFCVDAAPALAPVFGAARAAIALSATLSPPEWQAALLGFDRDRLATLRVAGTDLRSRRRVVIDPRHSTRSRDRERTRRPLAAALDELLDTLPGNALVLAAGYAELERLALALAPRRHCLRVQRQDENEAERAAHLEALRAERDVALLAIAGGALAEGVDTSGAGLSAVIVIGPCLPAADAYQELVREQLDETLGDGFAGAYALPGITRVVQSAGRLIRGEEDRGLVVLVGERFLREPYQGLLPQEWFPDGGPESARDDPAAVARAFFGAAPEEAAGGGRELRIVPL